MAACASSRRRFQFLRVWSIRQRVAVMVLGNDVARCRWIAIVPHDCRCVCVGIVDEPRLARQQALGFGRG